MYKVKGLLVGVIAGCIVASTARSQEYDLLFVTFAQIDNMTAAQCDATYEKARTTSWKYDADETRRANATRQYLRRGLENLCLAKYYTNEVVRFQKIIQDAETKILEMDARWASDKENDPSLKDYEGRRKSQESLVRDIKGHNLTIKRHRNDITTTRSFGRGDIETAVNAAPTEAKDHIIRIFGALPPLS